MREVMLSHREFAETSGVLFGTAPLDSQDRCE